jgi:hypothetical protein
MARASSSRSAIWRKLDCLMTPLLQQLALRFPFRDVRDLLGEYNREGSYRYEFHARRLARSGDELEYWRRLAIARNYPPKTVARIMRRMQSVHACSV